MREQRYVIEVDEKAFNLTKSVSELSKFPVKTTASLILTGDCNKLLKKMMGDKDVK